MRSQNVGKAHQGELVAKERDMERCIMVWKSAAEWAKKTPK